MDICKNITDTNILLNCYNQSLDLLIKHFSNLKSSSDSNFDFNYFFERKKELRDYFQQATRLQHQIQQLTHPDKKSNILLTTPEKGIAELQKDQRRAADALRSGIASIPDRRSIPGSKSFRVTLQLPLLITYFETRSIKNESIEQKYYQAIQVLLQSLAIRIPEITRYCFHKRFNEFIECLTSALSFLSSLIQKNPELLIRSGPNIIENIIYLLKIAPQDSHSNRRHLIISLHHIISVDKYRPFFEPHLDTLLDENILLGGNRATLAQNRSVAYSYLSELEHYFRLKFNVNQINKIINVFSCNLHDSSLAIITQINAAKLLMNMIEPICKLNDVDITQKNALLNYLLSIIVEKFVTLDSYIDEIITAEEYRKKHKSSVCPIPPSEPIVSSKEPIISQILFEDNKFTDDEIFEFKQSIVPVGYGVFLSQKEIQDTPRDVRQLIRLLFMGLKTLLFCVSSKSGNRNDASSQSVPLSELDENQLKLVVTFTEYCFRIIPKLFNSTDTFPGEVFILIYF